MKQEYKRPIVLTGAVFMIVCFFISTDADGFSLLGISKMNQKSREHLHWTCKPGKLADT